MEGKAMAKRLSGILAPMCTPFVNQEVSIENVRNNMHKYRTTALAGYFVLGSNGENKSLTEKEKLEVLETVVSEKAEQQVVLAGAGFESTRQTVAFSKKAAGLGADYVTIVTPSYFKKRFTDEALVRYYTDVADAIPIPVVVYNAPGFTGMTVSTGLIANISQHPNVAGMKDTSKGNMSGYLEAAGEDFDVLSGTVSTLFESMALGATGGVVSLANAFPEPCCRLYEAFAAGNMDDARKLHFRLFRLNRSVSGSFGVAGVKYAMELGGFYGGDPRLPLLPITEDGKESIRNAVRAAGLI
jgi:4-hydroxy-2-oxoglutarate aldolase